jgi:predicted PurR-regulated permease PerM
MWERKILNARWGTLPGRTMTLQIADQIRLQMQLYLGVLAVTNTVLGVLIWAAFRALGVPHAVVWGFAAALLHIIPYAGPAVIAVGSGLVTAVQYNSLGKGLAVAGVTLLLTTIIGMVISTSLAGRASRMNTTMVFVSLLFWGWLWGLSGLLLGIPITMAIKVLCARVESLGWIDDLLGEDGTGLAVAMKARPAADENSTSV